MLFKTNVPATATSSPGRVLLEMSPAVSLGTPSLELETVGHSCRRLEALPVRTAPQDGTLCPSPVGHASGDRATVASALSSAPRVTTRQEHKSSSKPPLEQRRIGTRARASWELTCQARAVVSRENRVRSPEGGLPCPCPAMGEQRLGELRALSGLPSRSAWSPPLRS